MIGNRYLNQILDTIALKQLFISPPIQGIFDLSSMNISHELSIPIAKSPAFSQEYEQDKGLFISH